MGQEPPLVIEDHWLKRRGDTIVSYIKTDVGLFTAEVGHDDVDDDLDLLDDLDKLHGVPRKFHKGRIQMMWAGWVRVEWVCPDGCRHEPVMDDDSMVPCPVCMVSPQTTCFGVCSIQCLMALRYDD